MSGLDQIAVTKSRAYLKISLIIVLASDLGQLLCQILLQHRMPHERILHSSIIELALLFLFGNALRATARRSVIPSNRRRRTRNGYAPDGLPRRGKKPNSSKVTTAESGTMASAGLSEIPQRIGQAFAWAPPWLGSIAVLVGSAAIALILYNLALRLLARLGRRWGTLPQLLIDRGRGPVAALLLVMVLGAALPAAMLSYPVTLALGHVLLVAFILAVGWGLNNALVLGGMVYVSRFRLDVADNLLARKHITQVRILQRALQILILIITVGTALMTIGTVRQFGVSLFASAGAAGLVVGLAARPVLSNLLAGIQIALAQPIRVEDAVVVEGEWGWIEEINSTYVVVRIWDLRRLILPLTYFIEKPFQNWTHRSADLLGSVHLNVDWTVPVDVLRKKLEEIAHQSKIWDGKVQVLQVVEATGPMVQLRILVSARNSGQAWDLRCEVREKMVAFLQQEYPHALPRQRVEVGPEPTRAQTRAEDDRRPTLVRPDAA